jgi:hypothetical protein
MWVIEYKDGKIEVLGDWRFGILEYARDRKEIIGVYNLNLERFIKNEFKKLKRILIKYKLDLNQTTQVK